MQSERQIPQNSALRSPWVRGWIGLVVTVLMVNIVMVYFAVSTSPGLVNTDYYERGQNYEKTLISRQARAPDWVMTTDIPMPLKIDRSERIRLFLVDRAGQPVDPASVTFHAYRPSDAGRDFTLPMTREDRGRYVVEVSFPLIGVWDTLIAVGYGEDEYSISERIMIDGG